MPAAPANQIAGRTCPPVICQRAGHRYRWHDGRTWVRGDDLPAAIAGALPATERDRVTRHGHRRLGDPVRSAR